jgi:hypothetical protein
LHGTTPDAFAYGLAGYAVLMVVVQVRLLPLYARLRFTPAFWAFSFSWTAIVGLALVWLRIQRPAGEVVYASLVAGAVSLLTAAIAARSLLAILRGQFLPPSPTPARAPAPSAATPVRHVEPAPSLALRMRVAANRDRLTRELAEDADPGSSPERALRAAQLTSDRRRKRLVGTLRGIISDAHHPLVTRARVIIINRAAVLEAEEAINAMIVRLNSAEPVGAEGMAIAERMLSNAARSPLYNSAEPGTLRRVVRVATAALDTRPGVEGELAIAA